MLHPTTIERMNTLQRATASITLVKKRLLALEAETDLEGDAALDYELDYELDNVPGGQRYGD
jgi:hypothetical protein